ncbi:MAG: histidine phosphatase family protein [Thermoanaerobaculia bacterium]
MSRFFPLLLIMGVLGCATAPPSGYEEARGEVILVRHGETSGGGTDPALSEAGVARARVLAETLPPVDRIFTTSYLRTKGTAELTANRYGIAAETYDPGDLAGFATYLKALGGVTLVVGHSNTTGELVRLLGGDPGPPIAESEYDRMYRVSLPSGSTQLGRYGASFD